MSLRNYCKCFIKYLITRFSLLYLCTYFSLSDKFIFFNQYGMQDFCRSTLLVFQNKKQTYPPTLNRQQIYRMLIVQTFIINRIIVDYLIVRPK